MTENCSRHAKVLRAAPALERGLAVVARNLLLLFMVLLGASPVFAQEAGGAPTTGTAGASAEPTATDPAIDEPSIPARRAGDAPTRVQVATYLYDQVEDKDLNPAVFEEISILETVVLVATPLTDTIGLNLSFTRDEIESRGVDRTEAELVSGTTVKGKAKERFAGDMAVGWQASDSLNVTPSIFTSEQDNYISVALGISLSYELGFGTTFDIAYQRFNDNVRETYFDGTTNGWADRITESIAVGLTRDLTPWWRSQIGGSVMFQRGVLEQPSNLVSAYIDDTTFVLGREREILPDDRQRNSITWRNMVMLPWTHSIGVDFRTYWDTWGIEANTAEARYQVPLRGDNSIVRFRARMTKQENSKYFKQYFRLFDGEWPPTGKYTQFRTQDSDLGEFQLLTWGIHYEHDAIAVFGPATRVIVAYDFHDRTDGIQANDFGVSITVGF